MAIRFDLMTPFGPDPTFNAADPLGSPLGEEPRAPAWQTTPAGASKLERRLVCRQCQVVNWINYFLLEAGVHADPYIGNCNLWEIKCEPFEKQLRISTTAIEAVFPGLAFYDLAVLTLTYENAGMRLLPGGIMKEESRPRLEQVPTGIVRMMMGADKEPNTEGEPGTLMWTTSDGGSDTASRRALYYGDHPRMEVGSREIVLTAPFSGTATAPFNEGVVNNAAFTLPCSGLVAPTWALKYMGTSVEASVVLPQVGVVSGLIRYRKSHVFHYLNATVGKDGWSLTWNRYFRARDQRTDTMKDMKNAFYYQHTPVDFGTYLNWL